MFMICFNRPPKPADDLIAPVCHIFEKREVARVAAERVRGQRHDRQDMRMTAVLLAGLWAGCAQAALSLVSTAATSNVSCSGGVCTATAANAVLNAHDLMGISRP